MRTPIFFLLSSLAFVGLCHTASAQTKIGVVCITSDSKIVVRAKDCEDSETLATVSKLTKKGLTGNKGPDGEDGAQGRHVAYTSRSDIALATNGGLYTEQCPAGKITVSGGCYSSHPKVVVSESYPFDGNPNGWRCRFRPAQGGQQATSDVIISYAICVDQ